MTKMPLGHVSLFDPNSTLSSVANLHECRAFVQTRVLSQDKLVLTWERTSKGLGAKRDFQCLTRIVLAAKRKWVIIIV